MPSHDTRLRPLYALRCLATVARHPEQTEVGAEMVRALEGRSRERFMARLKVHPDVARFVAEGRRLERTLSDRSYLEELPEESLGAAYARWTREEGLDAQSLIAAAGYVTPESREEDALLDSRGAAAHDLWHVVTGYDRDLLGEGALLHFTQLQTGNTGLILPAWATLLAHLRPASRRLVLGARRRARQAAWLPAADWEALLSLPLAEVREKLGLGAPPAYAPVYTDPRREASPLPAG